ncbi:lachesin [Copidosoma floridanum]|uniref:lachesin n=1 Tax=Copidosoma floridanum TaxID=29053 RepID=UPI0006C962CE|nr:lachesin [Copidosoma floridanum]
MKGTTMRPRITTLFFGLVVCLGTIGLIPLARCDEDKPSIKKISGRQVKSIGEEAEFECTVYNPENYAVVWNKTDKDNPQGIALTHNLQVNVGSKHSIKYYNNTSTYSLKVKNLTESDTGSYLCEILYYRPPLYTKFSEMAELQIRRAPSIIENATKLANVTEGKTFELYCTADGYPPPSISWRRENDDLLPSGGDVYRGNSLRIENAGRDDRGVYICVAENTVGPEKHHNATVYIQFPPVTTAVRPRVGQWKGYQASLECKVEAYPVPIVRWYKGGKEVGKNDFSGKESHSHEYVGTLNLSVDEDSFGEYVCEGVNELGSTKARLELFESIVPFCVGSC